MLEAKDGFGEQDADTEIKKLPLHKEPKVDEIYQNMRNAPALKNLL